MNSAYSLGLNDEAGLSTREKARRVNLDTTTYGSFAEIGAGQEVAAFFFKAGAASNTIAKTMSAYDMTFSNAIYGVEESGRYVCESRLLKMLDKEYRLLEQRLGIKMGFEKTFFAFANTVTTINFQKTNQGHGWIGIRFQFRPQSPPNDIILHAKLHDKDTLSQQNALGTIGVNLIYGAFYLSQDPEKFLISLMDGLSPERIEIDMLRITGPDFESIDNRLLSLQLVKNGLTNAAIFGPDGNVIQPSDLLYKKNILVFRGRFRPLTLVNLDMLKRGYDQFSKEADVKKDKIEILAELTLKDLKTDKEDIDYQDFLDRVDILSSLGCTVMISNYQEYYRLVTYYSQFTKEKIGIVLGVFALEMIFDEKYYEKLSGGILESFSQLFSRNIKLYVYPANHRNNPEELYTCANFELPAHLIDLFEYLVANDKIDNIKDFDRQILHILSDNVLKMIKNGEEGWEKMVPDGVTKSIKEKNLFGYQPKLLNSQNISRPTAELIEEAWSKFTTKEI
jgi:hypothetical protein